MTNRSNEAPMVVALLGLPGAGKTTLAASLGPRLGYDVLSTGALARRLAEKDEKLRAALAHGELAPEGVIRRGVEAALAQAKGGLLLDGYPRHADQALHLNSRCTRLLALHLRVSKHVVAARLVARMGESGREDDNPAAIKRRLAASAKNLAGVVAALSGVVCELDAGLPAAEVASNAYEAVLRAKTQKRA